MQEAGVPRKLAPTIGISVDHRRGNVSNESLSANVARLKEYKARLILFPRRSGQFKKLDSTAEQIKAVQDKEGFAKNVGSLFPVHNTTPVEAVTEVKKADMPKGDEAFQRLRLARIDARQLGARQKRAKAKAEEAAAKKK